jgi:alanyl-tRNA synthetase
VDGINLLTARLANADGEALRQMVDRFRQQYPSSGIAVLGSVQDSRPIVIAAITEDLVEKGINAIDLVKFVARPLGGGGGGRPTLAQAGGKEPSKLEFALSGVEDWVKQHFKTRS